MDTPYYQHAHLHGFGTVSDASPDLSKAFFGWYNAVFAEGALSQRDKAMVGLGVALAVQCPYCIEAYSTECLRRGLDAEQLTELLHVTTAIRGGASMVHGMQMLDVVRRTAM
jgi:4-carboxymuconolactone decarboxylase